MKHTQSRKQADLLLKKCAKRMFRWNFGRNPRRENVLNERRSYDFSELVVYEGLASEVLVVAGVLKRKRDRMGLVYHVTTS